MIVSEWYLLSIIRKLHLAASVLDKPSKNELIQIVLFCRLRTILMNLKCFYLNFISNWFNCAVILLGVVKCVCALYQCE